VVSKIAKMEDVGRELSEMTDSYRSLDSKAVRIDEDSFLFKPREKVVVGTFVLDSTQRTVA